MKAIMLYFEAVSGLELKFFKSEMIGVGVEEKIVLHLANILRAKWVLF